MPKDIKLPLLTFLLTYLFTHFVTYLLAYLLTYLYFIQAMNIVDLEEVATKCNLELVSVDVLSKTKQ